jgi:quercetin dioxygenase-like cupin family protein
VSAIVIPAGGGEVIGDAPARRVEILSSHDSLHATWSRFGPGRDGADLHVHHHHTDLFYVLDGELTLRLGVAGEPVAVGAGSVARVPPDVVHGFRNAGDAEVRYLNLHAPGREFAGFMRARRDGRPPPAGYDQHPPPADGGRPISEAVVGGARLVTDEPGLRVTLHADIDVIRIEEVCCEAAIAGATEVHAGHVRSLYVLAGELALTAGARERRAPAGSWLRVAPGVAHAVAACGPGAARYLDLRTPVG